MEQKYYSVSSGSSDPVNPVTINIRQSSDSTLNTFDNFYEISEGMLFVNGLHFPKYINATQLILDATGFVLVRADDCLDEPKPLSFYNLHMQKLGDLTKTCNSHLAVVLNEGEHKIIAGTAYTRHGDRLYVNGKVDGRFKNVKDVYILRDKIVAVHGHIDENFNHGQWLKDILTNDIAKDHDYIQAWTEATVPVKVGDRVIGQSVNGKVVITDPTFLNSITSTYAPDGSLQYFGGYSSWTVHCHAENSNNRFLGEHYPLPVKTTKRK